MTNDDLLRQTMSDPRNIVNYDDTKGNNVIFIVAVVALISAICFIIYTKLLPKMTEKQVLSGNWSCTQSEKINLNLQFKDNGINLDMNTYGINMILAGKYNSTEVEVNEDYKNNALFKGTEDYNYYKLIVNVDKYIVSGKEQTYTGDAYVMFGAKRNIGRLIIGNKPYICTKE